jgi:hypothetical protein
MPAINDSSYNGKSGFSSVVDTHKTFIEGINLQKCIGKSEFKLKKNFNGYHYYGQFQIFNMLLYL